MHADFTGPIEGRMFFIVTGAHSKWLEVVAMTSTTSKATIAEFQRLFAQFGLLSALVTDNGPQFTSEEWATFMSQHGIVHMHSSPYHPATNGAAERNVQAFKAALTAQKRGSLSWDGSLQRLLGCYRAIPHAMTGKTPAALFLHRELRPRLDLLHPVLPTEVSQPATASRVADQQRKISECSANSALRKSLEVGNSVRARVYNKPVKWLPGTVVRSVGAKSFEVKLASSVLVRRHLNQLRLRAPAPLLPELEKTVADQ